MPSKQAEAVAPAHPKMKASDLPLSSAVRSSIDGTVHTFKKQGNYDDIRKQVTQKFMDSDQHAELERSIIESVQKELEKNPSLLTMDASKATVLLEGAITRTSILPDAEGGIRKLLDGHRGEIEKGLRAIRFKQVGEEAALKEQLAGSKSDEDYAEEIAGKREARAAEREARAAEKKLMKEEKKKALMREFEESQAKLAEQKRKFEESKQAHDARELEQQQKMAVRYPPGDHHERRNSSRFDHPSRRNSFVREMQHRAPPKDPLSEVKIDDDIALRAILTDTKEPSTRNRHQPALEIDEALAPPPRKPKHISAINPNARDSPVPLKNLETKKETKSEATTDIVAPILNAPKGPKADGIGIRINIGKSKSIGEKTRPKSRSPDRAPSHHGESRDIDSTKYDDEKKVADYRKGSHRDSKDDKPDDEHREFRRNSRPPTPRETDRDDRPKRDYRGEEHRSSRKHSRSPSPAYRSTRRRERSPTPTYRSSRKHSRSRSRSKDRDREHRSSHRNRSQAKLYMEEQRLRKEGLSKSHEGTSSGKADPIPSKEKSKKDSESLKKEGLPKSHEGTSSRKADPIPSKEKSKKNSESHETSAKNIKGADVSKDRSIQHEDKDRGRSRTRSPKMPPPSARRESHAGSVDMASDRYKYREREASVARSHRDDKEVRVSSRRPESVHSARSRERSPPRKLKRSSSPPNIDRYVPGVGGSRRDKDRSRRDRSRSPDRERRDRSRDTRDRYRDRRDRSRGDRDRRDRSRDGSRRDRSRDRNRDKTRARSRSRNRDRDRERERERDRERPRDRERTSKRRRDSSYSRSPSREKRRKASKDRGGDRDRRRESHRRD